MVDPPAYNGTKPTMLIAGNNEEAKKKFTTEVLNKTGWENVVDMGDITQSRLLEPFAMVWISYAIKNNTWDHALALLRK